MLTYEYFLDIFFNHPHECRHTWMYPSKGKQWYPEVIWYIKSYTFLSCQYLLIDWVEICWICGGKIFEHLFVGVAGFHILFSSTPIGFSVEKHREVWRLNNNGWLPVSSFKGFWKDMYILKSMKNYKVSVDSSKAIQIKYLFFSNPVL